MPASPTDSTSASARSSSAAPEAATTAASPPPSGAAPTGSRGKAGADAPVCPQCGEPLERYLGDNPHKVGTGFCQAEGVRVPLPVAPQSSASSAASVG